jgi:hypothetical protein
MVTNLPVFKSFACNHYKLPPMNSVQLKADNELSIKRSILHLVTIPKLRSAHIFHFKENETEWRVYEPHRAPLAHHEVRGTMVYAIKQFRNPEFLLTNTKIRSNSFIQSVKPIIEYLESLDHQDKIYIILVFKNFSYAIGNYFDETAACQAILDYRPRKIERVIRKGDNYLLPLTYWKIEQKIIPNSLSQYVRF